jgi:hypothetical protein
MFHVKHLLLVLLLLPLISVAQHMGSTVLAVKGLPAMPTRDRTVDGYMDKFTETQTLTNIQKDWFYWTNYSRINPKRFWDSVIVPLIKIYPNLKNSYTNSLRKDLYNAQSLPLMQPNLSLIKVAQNHAQALADKKALPSHTSPSGVTFQQRMQSIGVKLCAGENISFGPGSVPLMLALLYIDEGVPDLGHRKNLLSPSYIEMGIGVGAYSDDRYMIIQDFACKQK